MLKRLMPRLQAVGIVRDSNLIPSPIPDISGPHEEGDDGTDTSNQVAWNLRRALGEARE